MSHRVHCGWGRFPSSRMTMVSRICRCRKCTCIAVLVAAWPGHPSTGDLCGSPLAGKGHSICPLPIPCGRDYPDPSRLFHLPMLSHHMTRHRSLRHLLPTLPALNLSLLALPVGGALPRYSSPLHRPRLIPRRLAGAADHANCLPENGPHANCIKQANQGVKCALEPAKVWQGNHSIVSVEEGSLVPTLLSTLAPLLCACYHHRPPVLHHCAHHHIKYSGG